MPISCYSPIEKGMKDSLFLNCPFSRNALDWTCWGWPTLWGLCAVQSGWSGSWSLEKAEETHIDLTHTTHVCKGAAVPQAPTLSLKAPSSPSTSPTPHLLSPTPRTLLFAMGELKMMSFIRWLRLLLSEEWISAGLSVDLGREHVCINEQVYNMYE